MLDLRRRIMEVNPEVVVCENDAYKSYAEQLLAGLGFKCVLIEPVDMKALFFRAERAVWLGSVKPPLQGHYAFAFSYTGGV